MVTQPLLKAAFAGAVALCLAGCLVSEEPVLDASTGRAKPLKPGAHVSCTGEDEPDCNRFALSRDKSGLYRLVYDEDEAVEMRFRRIARGAYAVQSNEGDDGYVYYYGAGDDERFRLTMMMCPELPEDLRASLSAAGELEVEGEEEATCLVKSVRALTEAAKAYHRGDAAGDDEFVLTLTPAPKGASLEE